MKKVSKCLLCLALTGGIAAAVHATPVWVSGNGSLVFSAGDGYQKTVNLNPVPVYDGSFQLQDSHTSGNLVSSAQGGVGHLEYPNLFGFAIPCETMVKQTDFSDLSHTAAELDISAAGLWRIASNNFGPTAYGFAAFPYIHGSVAAGDGSFATFELTANFGPFATRSPISFTQTFSAAGAYSFSYYDIAVLAPDFIPVAATENISFSVRMLTRGIDGTTDMILGCADDPGAPPPPQWWRDIFADRIDGGGQGVVHPVPEPSTWGAFSMIGLIALTLARRWRKK